MFTKLSIPSPCYLPSSLLPFLLPPFPLSSLLPFPKRNSSFSVLVFLLALKPKTLIEIEMACKWKLDLKKKKPAENGVITHSLSLSGRVDVYWLHYLVWQCFYSKAKAKFNMLLFHTRVSDQLSAACIVRRSHTEKKQWQKLGNTTEM